MQSLKDLFANNKQWAKSVEKEFPNFFEELSKQQNPQYLWIGCSDSRVPANEIVGLLPGELFVHRNVANIVYQNDLNCLSVIQYAVEVLKVKHIIVVGHYGCGGVAAAMSDKKNGLIDNWLRNVRENYLRNRKKIDKLHSHEEKVDKLCELNVIEQVRNVCQTTIVQNAWDNGQKLTIHGWVYGIKDGLAKDLKVSFSNNEQFKKEFLL